MNKLTTNVISMNNDAKNWKDKIVSISLHMQSNRNMYDLTIFHKTLGKKYWIDKDTINKLIDDCNMVNLHILLTGSHHVLPVHDISKITVLDEDTFIQYIYSCIHSK